MPRPKHPRENIDYRCPMCYRHYRIDEARPVDCPHCGRETWTANLDDTPFAVMSIPRSYWEPGGWVEREGEWERTETCDPSVELTWTVHGWTWLYVWGERGDRTPAIVFCRGEHYATARECEQSAGLHEFMELLRHPDQIITGPPQPGAWCLTGLPLDCDLTRWFLHRDGVAVAMSQVVVATICYCLPGRQRVVVDWVERPRIECEIEAFLIAVHEHASRTVTLRVAPHSIDQYQKEKDESCLLRKPQTVNG